MSDAENREAAQPAALWRGAIVNTLKSCLGTGILALPWAFAQIRSLPTAITLCVLFGAWSCYTMLLLHKCLVLAWPVAGGGYGGLATNSLGRVGGLLCSLNLFAHQLMCVAAYLVFIGDSLSDVFGGEAATYIITITPAVVLLCWLRDVRALSPVSAVGTAALLLALGAVLYEGCARFDTRSVAPSMIFAPSDAVNRLHVPGRALGHGHADPSGAHSGHEEAPSLGALGAFAGICIFAFAGHSEALPIIRSLRGAPGAHDDGSWSPRDAPYASVVLVSYATMIPAAVGFASAAVACFGEGGVRKNILLSLSSTVAGGLKALMALAVLFTCPIKMFPAFELTEAVLGLDRRADPSGANARVGPAPHHLPGTAATPAAPAGGEADEELSEDSRAPLLLEGAPRAGRESWRVALLRIAQRSALVLLAVLLALACPDFSFLTAIIGAFCNSLISFVLPPLMYVALLGRAAAGAAPSAGADAAEDGAAADRRRCMLSRALHALLAVLGLCVLVSGTYAVLAAKFKWRLA